MGCTAGTTGGGRAGGDGGGLRRSNPGTAPYGRAQAGPRYDRLAAGRRRRRRALFASVAVLALAVFAAAAAFGLCASVGWRLNAGVSDDLRAVLSDQRAAAALSGDLADASPFYMLLLGVDASDDRRFGRESDGYGASEANYRSDTIILARVDPGEKKVALVSIHRDTWYAIDGKERKINAAYQLGGAAKAVEVVSAYAGVPITHFAQIDMTGLAALIDALGGVDVDVPYDIDDEEYTGTLRKGAQTLTGEQALVFARSRHAYDDLGDGDRYRAAHQRLLVAAVAEKLMDASPAQMVAAVDAMADCVTTDLSPERIASLALAMRGIDVDHDVYSTMNPTVNETIDGASVEITVEDDWRRMMELVDAGERPDADGGYISTTDDINNPDFAVGVTEPGQTRVVVKDAAGGGGRAAEVLGQLAAAGWKAEDGGAANVVLESTVVVYRVASQEANAQEVAAQIGAIYEPAGDTWDVSGDVMVVVGAV